MSKEPKFSEQPDAKPEWEKKFDKKFDGWNAETFPAIKRFIKRLLKQKWEKEFEALWQVEMKYVGKPNGFNVKCELVSSKTKETIGSLVYKYIKPGKVRIKCKNDCIQIERIK